MQLPAGKGRGTRWVEKFDCFGFGILAFRFCRRNHDYFLLELDTS